MRKKFSAFPRKSVLAVAVATVLAGCGGGGGGATALQQDVVIGGSVGDGPVIGAQLVVTGANGKTKVRSTSDSRAKYSVRVPRGTGYPARISVSGGTDVVTSRAPDFTMRSVALKGSDRVVNVNPFTTFAVSLAEARSGGLDAQSLAAAQETVLDQLNFGLDRDAVANLVTTRVGPDNAPAIVKASEALGEYVRRTQQQLGAAGIELSTDELITTLSADLADGAVDGQGAHASARVAAVANLVAGEVALESLRDELRVGGELVRDRLNEALFLVEPNATHTVEQVGATDELLNQARRAVRAAKALTSDSTLDTLEQQLQAAKVSAAGAVAWPAGQPSVDAFQGALAAAAAASGERLAAANDAAYGRNAGAGENTGGGSGSTGSDSGTSSGGSTGGTSGDSGGSTSAQVADSFSRADQNPLSGNWESLSGTGFQLVSGAVKPAATNEDTVSGWRPQVDAFPADQFAGASLTAINAYDDVGVGVRLAAGGNGYVAVAAAGEQMYQLYRLDAGKKVWLGQVAQAPKAGDRLAMTAVGSSLKVFVNGVQVLSANDSTYAAGQPGVFGTFGNTNGSVLDDWKAGAADTWTPTAGGGSDSGSTGTGSTGGSTDSGSTGTGSTGGSTDSGSTGTGSTGGTTDSGSTGTGSTGGSTDSGSTGTGSTGGSTDSGSTGTGSTGGSTAPADTSPPVITSSSPAALAAGVSPSTAIRFTASEPLDPATVNATTFYLTGPGGTKVAAAVSYSNQTATLEPNTALDANTLYAVTVSTGVKDLAGNRLTSAYSWTFNTGDSAIPQLAQWQSRMVEWGKHWGAFQDPAANSWSDRFVNGYYDVLWVMYQIRDYTGQQEPWTTYIKYAKDAWRDNFYRPDNYHSAGYYRFPHGLLKDYLSGGDTTIDDLRAIRDNMAFSRVEEYTGQYDGKSQSMSREMAYALQANITAEKAGEPRITARVSQFVAWMENHLWEWKSGNFSGPAFFQPFMYGLTAYALIDFYEWEVANGRDPNAYWPKTHWSGIVEALADFDGWLYNKAAVREGSLAGKPMWVADYQGTGYGGFRYADRDSYEEGTVIYPDLNLLIAPAYAWVYKQTGDTAIRDAGNTMFESGVRLAEIDWSGKIFDQNYRWSFAFVKWMKEADAKWSK